MRISSAAVQDQGAVGIIVGTNTVCTGFPTPTFYTIVLFLFIDFNPYNSVFIFTLILFFNLS